jgi:hypothetical protein
MTGKHRRAGLSGLAVLAGLVLAAISPALSTTAASAAARPAVAGPAIAPVTDPVAIRPNQYFSGLVNGHAGSAAIQMGCFGPIQPGQLGHPLSGQTTEVVTAPGPTAADVGFTGSAGTSIQASLTWTSPDGAINTVLLATFSYFFVDAPISTSLLLPCSGTAVVSFVPQPGSSTAVTAKMTVTFVSQP